MHPTYILYLLTFLGFPIVGYLISKYVEINVCKKYFKWIFLLFCIHNVLFIAGFSIKGDYPDYVIFSLEYLFLCSIVFFTYRSTSIFPEIVKIIGTGILVVGFLQGLIGILMFLVVWQDFETDKIYNFNSNNKIYQTRRYSFGFATLDDTRYTFETYRNFNYLPFEKLVNETELFELKNDLDFNSNKFSIRIKDSSDRQILEFSSANGKKYSAIIH